MSEPVFRLFRNHNLKQRVARFRQVNQDKPNVHHDALEFPDGQVVLVTELVEGQRVSVLQLPVTERTANEAAIGGGDREVLTEKV